MGESLVIPLLIVGDSGGKTDPEEVRSRLRTGRTRQELEAAMNEVTSRFLSWCSVVVGVRRRNLV